MLNALALLVVICLFIAESTEKFSYAPKWAIDGEQLEATFNAEVGERFESNSFDLSNSTWRIISYPNGNNEDSTGSYMIFAYLEKMPSSWKEISICLSIISPATNSRLTRVATYNDTKGLGWYPQTLLLEEIKNQNLTELQWVLEITVLRIISTDDAVLYEHKFSYRTKQRIEWKVRAKMVEQMKNAYMGKAFQLSERMNHVDDMWSLRVYPQGKDEGFVDLYLSLNALPPNVWSMNVKYTLECTQTNTSNTNVKVFNYNNSVWSWSKQLLSLEEFAKNDEITFVADIEILNLYDRNGDEMVTFPHIIQLKSQIKDVEQSLNSRIDELDVNSENNQCNVDIENIKQKYESLASDLKEVNVKYDELQSALEKMQTNQNEVNDKFAKDVALILNQLDAMSDAYNDD